MIYILQVLFVLGLMAVGYGARKRGVVGEAGTREMARVLMSIIYPCLIFTSVTRLNVQALVANWKMPLLAILLSGTGLGLGLLSLRFISKVNTQRASAILFQSMINNYLFLPLPLVLLLWGKEGVALMVFASIGFELVVWSVGIFLFNRANRLSDSLRMMLGPPLISLLFSILWVCVRDLFHPALPSGEFGTLLGRVVILFQDGMKFIGHATIGVSMIVAGSRIAALNMKNVFDPHIWIISTLRLLVIPIAYILLLKLFHLEPVAYGILCVIGVMPVAVASLVFSERFDGDTDFIATTLLVTHLGAIITVPLLLAWALPAI